MNMKPVCGPCANSRGDDTNSFTAIMREHQRQRIISPALAITDADVGPVDAMSLQVFETHSEAAKRQAPRAAFHLFNALTPDIALGSYVENRADGASVARASAIAAVAALLLEPVDMAISGMAAVGLALAALKNGATALVKENPEA